MVGGKGANLGSLSRVAGVQVPPGFCVTTDAFARVMGEIASMEALLDELSFSAADNREVIDRLGREIRNRIAAQSVPADIAAEVSHRLDQMGSGNTWAVRSSATAEDLPTASFAGQQDSFLHVTGQSVLEHISQCWASLFTERAISYRVRNGFDHRRVQLSVIVQQMVDAEVSGVAFTADPVTGNRKVLAIDAVVGLGEQLISGQVNADHSKVREGKIIEKGWVLTDQQMAELETIARKIEAHFRTPQDIEWCLSGGTCYIVQSRPITTLFPIPEAPDDHNRVYVSVGHQQMMTDPIRPLGLSFYLMITPATMRTAAGRLFVDVTPHLASPEKTRALFETLGKSEPLIRDALVTVSEQTDFLLPTGDTPLPARPPAAVSAKETDPGLPAALIQANEQSLDVLKSQIRNKTGPELFDFILEDISELKRVLFQPDIMAVIMTGMNAASWINEKMEEWLGEVNAADSLSQSVPNNVTSEMGLALLDVADAIRPFPEVVEYLHNAKGLGFREQLTRIPGGDQALAAIDNFLITYGMRCTGEIDITRTRWSENPATLFPLIISNIKNFEPGEAQRKFDRGLQQALAKEKELMTRLKQLPDGEQKAAETKQRINAIRNFAGFREYPKYGIVSRYQVYKEALMRESAQMVADGLIRSADDCYYLFFDEMHEAARSGQLDYALIDKRKREYEAYEKLIPPRVITSEGEVIAGRYQREGIPEQAIPGLAVSAGVVEGRARVLFKMEGAELQPGDILVTPFTDPSWTPLFVTIRGLITEVGGLMTHGAVIAREYGLPAVVCVEHATTRIKDGQRVRLNGTEGYVEIISEY